MIKVVTIVGTRPEIIRMSCVLKHLNKYFKHYLIHTGQNYDYELNKIFFKDLELKSPDFFLNISRETPCSAVGDVISKTEKILKIIKPDAVFVLGDTNSCLGLYSAKRLKIPTFHFEAGNRCYDQNVPEEINRVLVDHMADINLTYSTISRQNLLKEGLKNDYVIKVGSPLFEVFNFFKEKIHKSKILKSYNLKKDDYFLISIHRDENTKTTKDINNICTVLNEIQKKYKKEIIFPCHPRIRLKILKKVKNKNIKIIKPLNFTDYAFLQINSFLVLSDSGSISEESSILKFKALNLRSTHERHEAMEEGTVMMVGMDLKRILRGIRMIADGKLNYKIKIVRDYKVENVSSKIVKIINSYIPYINKNIWKK
ncbi:UDP-N-acetylglucosamine 2-epimerase (non-hydrolyzing) [Candidatus Pelagibacter ubique]|nr:UDP-N-acetylglucosamine 2-epimerase (non-hydrolyzing) [Candidatus Pelagibacter ubique]